MTNYTNEWLDVRTIIQHVPERIHVYGKLKFIGGGDMCHSAFVYKNPDTTQRDASYLKVCLHYLCLLVFLNIL